MTIEHELTDRERDVLQHAANAATDAFAASIATFMQECVRNGLHPRICGAGFSMYAIANIAKVMAICSGIPREEVDTEVTNNAADETHQHLVKLMSEYIVKGNQQAAAERN